MKSHDEFKKAVLEKAERFEKARKSRNRRIIESLSLCSVCIVIALTFFLGDFSFIFEEDHKTAASTTDAPNKDSSDNSFVIVPNGSETVTSTSTTPSWVETTTIQTTVTSTTCDTTFESTCSTSTTLDHSASFSETTASTAETITSDPTDGMILASLDLITLNSLETEERHLYADRASFEQAMAALYQSRLDDKTYQELLRTYDEEFFKEKELVVVYVPQSWKAYTFEIKNGALGAEFRCIEKADMTEGNMLLHIYEIPKGAETLTVYYPKPLH